MESNADPSVSAPEEPSKEVPEVSPPKEKSSPVVKEVRKRSKKEERQLKKDERSVDQFIKSLDSIPTTDEKFSLLSRKFAEVAEEGRRLQAFIKQLDKKFAGFMKEKEQLQLEYNRTVLVKSKLENLCRELQKQNKSIKEESMLKIREEEERRKETQAKFQSALSEITALLQQNNEKNSKLREDNVSMSNSFKSVLEKYELREQQVEKMAKQMGLEQQLADAKLAKAGLEAQAERERLLAERAQLKLELGQFHARIIESQNTETSLRGQLAIYTDKYDEFQNALVKSNQVFGGFKGEMEKMSKKIVKLEKECISWKKRWESSQVAMLEMATDKRLWDERAATSERQLAQLQRLCRSMQAERTLLLNTLKEHNIERPPLPVLPPAPPAPPAQPAAPSKVDAMAANCAQLKQSLAQLQNQLNVLTTKKEEENQAKAEQPASGKSKKGKGKKSKADKEKAAAQEKVELNGELNEATTSQEDTKPLEAPTNVANEVATVIENADASKEEKSNDCIDTNNDTKDATIPTTKTDIEDTTIQTTTVAKNDIEETTLPTTTTVAKNDIEDTTIPKTTTVAKNDIEDTIIPTATTVTNGTDSNQTDKHTEVETKSDSAVVNTETNGTQLPDSFNSVIVKAIDEPCITKDSALSQPIPDDKCAKSAEVEPLPVLEVLQKNDCIES